ncbi:MAG TPA: crotonase/enoyl-CoA hydratase family protein [Gammaproteobacteria bacterium]
MNEKSSLYTLNTNQPTRPDVGYNQLITHYEEKHKLQWCFFNPYPRPCFTFTLTRELMRLCEQMCNKQNAPVTHETRYFVSASSIQNIYSLGGDLELFKQLVQKQDKVTLTDYAHTCLDLLYIGATMHQKGITHISLVQGDALGGGFEVALSSDILIAERNAKFGFPDILFNSFPGIGAYTLLSRKIGPAMAERVLMSGKLFSAEELYEIGLIDILANEGEGEMMVYSHINRENRCENAITAIRKIREIHNPLNYNQMLEVANLWVDSAMKLNKRDLRMIDKLISKQKTVTMSAA